MPILDPRKCSGFRKRDPRRVYDDSCCKITGYNGSDNPTGSCRLECDDLLFKGLDRE